MGGGGMPEERLLLIYGRNDDWQDWMIRLLPNLHCELHFTSLPAHSILPGNGQTNLACCP